MQTLHIPADEAAEAAVAAIAVASDRGYRLASSRLEAADFYVPLHRRLFEAVGHLCHLSGPGEDVLNARVEYAARAVDRPIAEIAKLIQDRPLMWDKNGHLAARIARASEARRVMEAAADLFNRIGAGEDPREVMAELPILPLLPHGRSA